MIEEKKGEMKLPDIELRYLEQLKRFLSAAPDEAKLIEESQGKFARNVPEFKPSNYDL